MSKPVLEHATDQQLDILLGYVQAAAKALKYHYTINGREYLENAVRYARYLEGQEIAKLEEQAKEQDRLISNLWPAL